MRKALMIVAMVGVIAMAGTAEAVVSNWTGIGDGSTWTLAGNWDSGAPNPNIAGGDTYNVGPTFSPSYLAGQVEVGTGGVAGTATLNINNTTGTLTTGGFFLGRSFDTQVTQTSGTHNTGASNGIGMAFSGVGGLLAHYDIDGGSLNNTGFTYIGTGAGDTGIVDQTDGTVVLGNGIAPSYFNLSGFGVDAGTSTYQISGGSLTINVANTEPIGIGYFTADGGAGTFKVDGSVAGGGPSAITWNGNTTVSGGGALKGALAYTMDASGVTPIDLNGILTLIDSPDLVLDMSGLGGPIGDIPLVNNDAADAIVGTFNVTGLGLGYTLTYFGGDGNDLVLVAPPIPEPAGLGLIGLALLAVRRKRS